LIPTDLKHSGWRDREREAGRIIKKLDVRRPTSDVDWL